MRVLLVEPSDETRLGLQIMMQGEGYPEARTATSGRAALDVLGLRGRSVSESDVDVIVMDSVLPDLEALEVCRQIKDAPRWHDTPVLLLTDTPEEHAYDLVCAANACDYVSKPVRPPAFLGRLRLACRLKEELDTAKARKRRLLDATRQLEHLNEELQRLSIFDELTGLANRGFFNTLLAQEWGRAVRGVLPLSLILIDIDFFKNYNDYYGHQKGDECLYRVAGVLNNSARRPGDYAARYGGEEFVVILPHTGTQGAVAVAEELRRHVEDLRLEHVRSPIADHVTISLGVASTVPERRGSADALVAAADRAVYQTKRDGRNRVCLYAGPLGEVRVPPPGRPTLVARRGS